VECHVWPSNLSANQQSYQQRCSEQATPDQSKKADVGIMSHMPLLA
jgi:hypothetical protein